MYLDLSSYNSSVSQSAYGYDPVSAGRSEKSGQVSEQQSVQEEKTTATEGEKTPPDPNTLRALDAANLPATEKNITLVENMMREGMCIDRQNLQSMYRLLLKNPEADSAQLVRMSHMGLEITDWSIRQFESYENRSHQLMDGLDAAFSALEEESLALFDKEGGTGVADAMSLLRDLTELAEMPEREGSVLKEAENWLEAAGRLGRILTGKLQSGENAGTMQPGLANMARQDGMVGVGRENAGTVPPSDVVSWQKTELLSDWKDVSPLQQQVKQVVDLLKELLMPDGEPDDGEDVLRGADTPSAAVKGQPGLSWPVSEDGEHEEPTFIRMPDGRSRMPEDSGEIFRPLPQKGRDPEGMIGFETANRAQTLEAEKRVSQSNAESRYSDPSRDGKENVNLPERGTDIKRSFADKHYGLLREMYTQAQKMERLNPESASYRAAGNAFLEKAEQLRKAALESVRSALFGEKGLLSRAESRLTDQLSLRPEDVADERRVEQLYEKLLTKMEHLSHSLSGAGLGQSQAMDSILQLQENVQFMNQLNQVYQYVQLPLSMFEQHTNGELYVYTNKKHLADADGSLSALLHLDMDHIGPLDVHVQMSAGSHVATHFYLPDEEMIDFISQNIHLLDEKLSEKGYQVSSSVTMRESREEGKTPSVMEHMMEHRAANVRTKLVSVNSFDMKA